MWAKDSPNIITIPLSLILFDGFDGQFFGERTRIFKARAEMGGDYPQMEEEVKMTRTYRKALMSIRNLATPQEERAGRGRPKKGE